MLKQAYRQRLRQLMELYEAQEYTVRPMMRAVPGVADVNTNGGLEEQFVVQPDPVRLTMHGVTAGELAAAVSKNVENAGGGIIRRGAERFTVRTDARVMNATQIGAIPVKFAAGVLPIQPSHRHLQSPCASGSFVPERNPPLTLWLGILPCIGIFTSNGDRHQ